MNTVTLTAPLAPGKRIYARKFDHDAARARHAAGETVAALAREYGVNYGAVARVVDPRTRARMDAITKARYAASCETCGAPCLSATHAAKRLTPGYDGRSLCHACRSKEKRAALRLDTSGAVVELWCPSCTSWLPPGAFGRGQRYHDLREGGFHNQCRACGTRARIAYRERHKVPCEGGCGRYVEGSGCGNRRATSSGDRPHLCHACWHASPDGRASVASAVAASAISRRREAV